MADDDDDNGFGQWGGYMEAKKSKLEEQYTASSHIYRKSNLFEGVSIFVNGLTNPSADELKRIMMVHGGTYHHYERPHTKFIIASNLPDVKVRNMDTSKIIKANWVVDCMEKNRLLDYKPYLLYTNCKTTQPRLNLFKCNEPTSIIKKADVEKVEKSDSKHIENEVNKMMAELQKVASGTRLPPWKIGEKEPKKSITRPSNTSTNTTNASQANNSKNYAITNDSIIKNTNTNNTSINKTVTNKSSNAALTAVDPAFLEEFFKKSRLHHIATLSSYFKQYICDLRLQHGKKPFPQRQKLLALGCNTTNDGKDRYVMHIDMDCFFVSVGIRSRPDLRGQPVAVTHSKGGSTANDVPVHPLADRKAELELFAERFEQQLHDNVRADKVRSGFEEKMSLSEIASCSYEARRKGIRNGMFVGQALKLCPDLKTIPYDFEGYREVARTLYETVAQYTLNIEAVSCDEMFVELTDLLKDMKIDIMAFVRYLRHEVYNKTGCPCSAGVGPNKLLARMATKEAKPNGQFVICNVNVAGYMANQSLESLPGVGFSMAYKLKQAGLAFCRDVQVINVQKLEAIIGKKSAETLYEHSQGIDNRPLIYEQERKSISAEVNYGIRFTTNDECETFLRQLCEEVHKRLKEIGRKTKQITLKFMVRAANAPIEASKFMGHGLCDNMSKSSLLNTSTDDLGIITVSVLSLMDVLRVPPQELRGIGIQLSKLECPAKETKNDIRNLFSKMKEKQKAPVKSQRCDESIADDRDRKCLNSEKGVKGLVPGKRSRLMTSPLKPIDFLPSTSKKAIHKEKERAINKQKKHEKANNNNNDIEPPNPVVDHVFGLHNNMHPMILNYINHNLEAINCVPDSDEEVSVSAETDENINYENKMKTAETDENINYENKIKTAANINNKGGNKKEKKEEEERNSFSIEEYKQWLCTWVDTVPEPDAIDLQSMRIQLYELIEDDNIDTAYHIIKYFCRVIKMKRPDNCLWHYAYLHVEQAIQQKLSSTQGYILGNLESIGCPECTFDR